MHGNLKHGGRGEKVKALHKGPQKRSVFGGPEEGNKLEEPCAIGQKKTCGVSFKWLLFQMYIEKYIIESFVIF